MVRVSAVTKVARRKVMIVLKQKGYGGEYFREALYENGGMVEVCKVVTNCCKAVRKCWEAEYEEGRGCSFNECGDHGKIAAERPEEKMTFLK